MSHGVRTPQSEALNWVTVGAVRFAANGISLSEMHHRKDRLDVFIRDARAHGATEEQIREAEEAGYNVTR